jgi:hypothetical protein
MKSEMRMQWQWVGPGTWVRVYKNEHGVVVVEVSGTNASLEIELPLTYSK